MSLLGDLRSIGAEGYSEYERIILNYALQLAEMVAGVERQTRMTLEMNNLKSSRTHSNASRVSSNRSTGRPTATWRGHKAQTYRWGRDPILYAGANVTVPLRSRLTQLLQRRPNLGPHSVCVNPA